MNSNLITKTIVVVGFLGIVVTTAVVGATFGTVFGGVSCLFKRLH